MASSSGAEFVLDSVRESDYPSWRRLFQGYADFYKRDITDESAKRVFSWIMDENHILECIVVRQQADGDIVGFAHFQENPRPLTGSVACFLNDLFVDPAVRGGRLGDMMLEHLRSLCKPRGWSMVRWLTADDNYRARALYDRHAQRTMWITYQMDPCA
eukprot:ANDGO_05128.mRNA.1 D-amino-acid N-acetyltransferase HPA3